MSIGLKNQKKRKLKSKITCSTLLQKLIQESMLTAKLFAQLEHFDILLQGLAQSGSGGNGPPSPTPLTPTHSSPQPMNIATAY